MGAWARAHVGRVLPAWLAAHALIAAALVAARLATSGTLRDAWTGWDGGWFLHIAAEGYAEREGAPAFYPLYPLLVRAGGIVLGGRPELAAVIVSLAASLVALALLRQLALERLGEEAARRAVWLLALFPYAVFLQLAYSEALYLAVALAAALAVQRGRLVPAGALAGVALLTRPVAVALLAAVAVAAWHRRRLADGLLALAAGAAGLGAYVLLLVQQGRSPLAFLKVEHLWGRHPSPWGPLGGIWQGLRAAWAGVLQLTFGPDKPYWTPSQPDLVAVLNVTNLAAALLALAALPLVQRRLGAVWTAYTVVAIALPLANPADGETPLLSFGRFVLALFPAFLAVAATPLRPRAFLALAAVSGCGLAAVTAWWATGRFVA